MNLKEIYRKLETKPLKTKEEIDKYYIDTFNARGEDPILPIKNRLGLSSEEKQHILFAGHKGSGKSTELNKFEKDNKESFFIINFSVMQDLDLYHFHYTQLILLAFEKLFEKIEEHKLKIKNKLYKSIKSWVETEDIKKIISTERGGEGAIEVGAEAKFFRTLFTGIRLKARASTSVKKEVIQHTEPKLSEFIQYCNDLIREVEYILSKEGKKLVFIFEDLDKLTRNNAKELFHTHSNVLTSLDTHIIYTYPISLRYSSEANTLTANYGDIFDFPMIKVVNKDGSDYSIGQDVLHRIIEKRISMDCFKNEALVYDFIKMSGGCIRDLFRMIRRAADFALGNNRTQITKEDFIFGYRKLKTDYENTIAETTDERGRTITVEEYFEELKKLAKSPLKKVNNTQVALTLRHSLCIIEYNGENWCDVHPVVKEILKERNLI